MLEDDPREKYTVWADNPDTGKRHSFGFASSEDAYAKMAQLKRAKFRAVELIVSKPPKIESWPSQ
jgi:hypothetical protein